MGNDYGKPSARATRGRALKPDSKLRRWSSVLLRAAHLVSVIGFAAHFIADNELAGRPWAIAVFLTGTVLFAVDFAAVPSRLFELSSASVAAKLVLVALLILAPKWQTPLFWGIVVWSVIFAHAPASFRHAKLGPRHPD